MTLAEHLLAARREIDVAYGALTPIKTQPEAAKARQALIRAKNAVIAADKLDDPRPVPPVPTRPVRKKGAIVVNAGNCSPDLLRQAGITHVCVEINEANIADFNTPRWDGFKKGWFVVSRGNDGDSVFGAIGEAGWKDDGFVLVDTESHKADMGGSLAWTERLYAELRRRLGPAYQLYNITFGIHQNPTVVNHAAFRIHGIVPIWETYDGAGATLGVARTVSKANAEGWSPAHVCLGDKSLAAECAEAKALSGLGDVWCWAPEQAGADILELAKVPV